MTFISWWPSPYSLLFVNWVSGEFFMKYQSRITVISAPVSRLKLMILVQTLVVTMTLTYQFRVLSLLTAYMFSVVTEPRKYKVPSFLFISLTFALSFLHSASFANEFWSVRLLLDLLFLLWNGNYHSYYKTEIFRYVYICWTSFSILVAVWRNYLYSFSL